MWGERQMKSFLTLRILDCEFAVIEPDPTAFDPLKLYDIFRRYLEHEDNLINSRLTWSLTIHGFLFASYGILLGKIADEFSALPKPEAHALLGEHIIAALFALQALVAILGVLVGFSSRRAIIASHNAIQHLVTIAHSQGRPLEITARGATVPLGSILLPRIVGGGARILPPGERRHDHTVGARSYYLLLPALIMWMWTVLVVLSIGCAIASSWYRYIFFSRMGL
jgi:hypothetical protein